MHVKNMYIQISYQPKVDTEVYQLILVDGRNIWTLGNEKIDYTRILLNYYYCNTFTSKKCHFGQIPRPYINNMIGYSSILQP